MFLIFYINVIMNRVDTMKKIIKSTILSLAMLSLCACTQKENSYKLNDEVEIKGKISSKTIVEDGISREINVITPSSPIIIDNKNITEIEISYDKSIKDENEVTIKGIITEDTLLEDSKYAIEISDIEDPMVLANTYHHDDFSMTIPTSIIEYCSIEKIENGFIIYSRSNKNVGGEVFRVISLSKEDFNAMLKNQEQYIERVTSNSKKTIIMTFPTTTEYSDEFKDEYELIGNSINKVKNNIKQK